MGSPHVDASNFHVLPPSQLLRSLLASAPSPSFPEPSMAEFSGIRPSRRRRSEPESDDGEADEDDEEEEQLGRQAGKKRRLSPTQVQHLEKSFLVDNKLEPERKTRLAMELNLQPRQVAIWFQNRRARFKTKQLQKDFALLKSSFDSLKSRFDHMLTEKDLLQNEVCLLRAELKMKERSESESPIQIQMEKAPSAVVNQEEASSMKSDVVDSESPNLTSPEPSNFSQGDLTVPVASQYGVGFGKAEEEADFHGASCSGFGVPGLEGQPSYWPWPY